MKKFFIMLILFLGMYLFVYGDELNYSFMTLSEVVHKELKDSGIIKLANDSAELWISHIKDQNFLDQKFSDENISEHDFPEQDSPEQDFPEPTEYDVYKIKTSNELLYRDLLTNEQQKAYDTIYFNALDGNAEFDIDAKITTDEFSEVFEAVRYDNPEIFWLDYFCNYYYEVDSNYVKEISLNFNYTFQELDRSKENFENSTRPVIEQAMSITNRPSQIKFIHDHLIETNDYNTFGDSDQSAYGAIVTGKSVCAGYAAAFQYYMQSLGIPCALISGESNGTGHAWNMVEIDGEYYEIDVTWNDPVGNTSNKYYYNYFLINESVTMLDRTRRGLSVSMPKALGEKYSYDNYFYDE